MRRVFFVRGKKSDKTRTSMSKFHNLIIAVRFFQHSNAPISNLDNFFQRKIFANRGRCYSIVTNNLATLRHEAT